MHPRLSFLALPLTRFEVPKWPRLIAFMSIGWDEGLKGRWRRYSKRVVRGKQHDQLMILDLGDWAQRMTFFLGRYYELGVLKVLDALLRPGDHFVDIGANIGMITLHARSLVGDSGRIDCFEPNPECATAIRSNLALNSITNVHVHQCGLAARAGRLRLNLTSEHSGTATFAETGHPAVRTFDVEVRVGDQELGGAPRLVKIDVEGFELQVLQGLKATLTQHRPFVITEIIETQLANAGTNTAEILAFFRALGYRPHGIGTQRRTMRHRMQIHELENAEQFKPFADILWVHGDRLHMLPRIVWAEA